MSAGEMLDLVGSAVVGRRGCVQPDAGRRGAMRLAQIRPRNPKDGGGTCPGAAARDLERHPAPRGLARRLPLLPAAPAATGAALTVGGLLEVCLAADHLWKPATRVSHRSVAGGCGRTRFALILADRLTLGVVRAAISRWACSMATSSVVGGRYRELRSALSWGWDERLLDVQPLRGDARPGSGPAPASADR